MTSLSLRECRKYLSGSDLTDQQVERIKDSLIFIINTLLNGSLREWKPGK